jgi:hypothetical protein
MDCEDIPTLNSDLSNIRAVNREHLDIPREYGEIYILTIYEKQDYILKEPYKQTYCL